MSSVDQLVQRLSAEVAAATERVHVLQTEAAKAFVGQEQRFTRFVALTDRIHAILQPRIEAFTKVNVFKDIEPNVSLELRGPEGRGFHGRTTTLSVPSSDACSGKVELSFHLGHDGPIENAIIDYRLEILPIFIKFESHDQLVIPIENPSEDSIAAWIDDKLVGFNAMAITRAFVTWHPWSWNHYADDVWRQLDPALWELTQTPWVVLQTVSRDKLQHMLADHGFRNRRRRQVGPACRQHPAREDDRLHEQHTDRKPGLPAPPCP